MTTNYRINEFLDEADRKVFEMMAINNPKRFNIEGNGDWGIAEGTVFENWEIQEFSDRDIIRTYPGVKTAFGLDFGYKQDPSAFLYILVDESERKLWICDEHYQKGMLNNQIAEMLKYKGYSKERIIGDSAEQKSIDELRYQLGIKRIEPAKKGPDSVRAGIQYLQQFRIYVHPSCTNTILELQNYIYDTDKKTGKSLNKPVDNYNHLLDSLRYACEAIRYKREVKAIGNPFAL